MDLLIAFPSIVSRLLRDRSNFLHSLDPKTRIKKKEVISEVRVKRRIVFDVQNFKH